MTQALVEVGIAQFTLPGEAESGDGCVVKISEQRAIIGVIDGLGHGPEAARAAQAAAAIIEAFDHEPVGAVMARCHEKLRGTRGAAITLVAFDAVRRQLDWLGAGNVAAVVLHPDVAGKSWREELFMRGGMAGVRMPSMAASNVEIRGGDIVAIATDGVQLGFIDGVTHGLPPQRLAERLLADYQTARDDALVVVARVREEIR
jgi:hypothetical protein